MSQILDASKEAENAIDAADGLLVCRLKDCLKRIDQQEKELQEKLARCALSERTKADIQADLNLLKQRRQESNALLTREDKDSIRKFSQSRKRVVKEPLEENRVKRRRLGTGRPRAMCNCKILEVASYSNLNNYRGSAVRDIRTPLG